MSGSGKPGKTFKITVLSTELDSATIGAKEEDIAYLVAGTDYIVQVVPVGGSGKPSGHKPSAQSGD